LRDPSLSDNRTDNKSSAQINNRSNKQINGQIDDQADNRKDGSNEELGETLSDTPSEEMSEYEDYQADIHTEDQGASNINDKPRVEKYSMALFKKSMQSLWSAASKSSSVHGCKMTHRRRFRSAFEYFTDSDHDLSTVFPVHLHLVNIISEDDESLFTTGIAVTDVARKTSADFEQYSIFLREKDVEVCPVGALAFYLLVLWTVSTPKYTMGAFCHYLDKHCNVSH